MKKTNAGNKNKKQDTREVSFQKKAENHNKN